MSTTDRDQRCRRLRLRQIGAEGRRAASRRAHRFDRAIGLGLRTGVAEGDVDAARGEIAGDNEADAFAARDERDFVNELHDR